jgi:hypothetical protein
MHGECGMFARAAFPYAEACCEEEFSKVLEQEVIPLFRRERESVKRTGVFSWRGPGLSPSYYFSGEGDETKRKENW